MTEDNAIQEDVLEESQTEVAEVEQTDAENKPVDARFDAIEALASKRAEEFDAEVAESEPEQEPEPEVDEPQEQRVKVKVDGDEMELPLSEVVKHYQKEATADKRLEQAARERQELEQLRAEIEARQQPEQEEQLPATGVDLDAESASRLSNAFDDLAVGSDEEKIEAAKVIKELLGGRGDNPAIQEDQIVSQAAQQALLQMQYQSAQQKFVEDYQDIVEDPTLYQLAMNVFNNAVPQSQTYDEAFKAAGETVKQWRDQLVGKNSVSDRQALKEQLPKEPNRVSTKANPTPKPKPETAQDIIAAMKASRGQPV